MEASVVYLIYQIIMIIYALYQIVVGLLAMSDRDLGPDALLDALNGKRVSVSATDSIPVLFGTRFLNKPNCVWYGDVKAWPWEVCVSSSVFDLSKPFAGMLGYMRIEQSGCGFFDADGEESYEIENKTRVRTFT